jgi:sugar phosphate isomerase/epimerase
LNSAQPSVVLSGFADEAARHKTLVEQFVAFAAMGLSYYSIRFVDAGNGVKNVMDLDKSEIEHVRRMQNEYGMRVASIGSPIGKVKLLDVQDGTANRFVPFGDYLKSDVRTACELAQALDTRLIRGFSFYPPKNDDPESHLTIAVDQIGRIVEECGTHDLVFGLEVEANLVGRNGALLYEIWQQVNHPALRLVFDAANLLSQGYSVEETLAEYRTMKKALGWLHVKDYKPADMCQRRDAYVDESQLNDFRPVDQGSGVYQQVFADLRETLPGMHASLQKLGVPGFFVELEPHIKGGGQFGGFSGPDGMGVAQRALTRLLDGLDIGYSQTTFADTQATT